MVFDKFWKFQNADKSLFFSIDSREEKIEPSDKEQSEPDQQQMQGNSSSGR